MALTPFHIAVQVRDIAEARRFYKDTLGCGEGRSDTMWVDFNLFGHQFVCHLNPSLGTRHRAAIGLAEETDSVVVVVSEETGAISYAHKGMLTRGVSLEELRAFLTSVLVSAPKSHKLSEWFHSSRFARPNGPRPAVQVAPKPQSK